MDEKIQVALESYKAFLVEEWETIEDELQRGVPANRVFLDAMERRQAYMEELEGTMGGGN